VLRFLAPLGVAVALAAPLSGADPSLSPFNIVDIKPAVTSVIVATVTMTMAPFARKNVVYSSTYSAKVFPYFFYNEKGRIWITVSDDDLRRAAKGGSVDFTGHALSEAGDERRVEGHATPTGPLAGKVRVKVYVTRRISLIYDTVYELKGPPAPKPAAIPTPAR
jgi:hypothetical protein